MSERAYGTLSRTKDGAKWRLEAAPHVMQVAKRLWRRGGKGAKKYAEERLIAAEKAKTAGKR